MCYNCNICAQICDRSSGDYMDSIKLSRGSDFISDPNPITKELLKDTTMQLVYYNFYKKDSLAITPDKEQASLILYILEGSMILYTKEREICLEKNDSVMFSDVEESWILTAQIDSKCLGVSTSHSQHVDSSNELMAMIEEVEKKDVYTSGHSRRVCMYVGTIALEMDPGYDIITLGNAADLHDIGKINVSIDILRKPGRLTKEEYDIIKQHPVDSGELLRPVGEAVAMAARQHHERMDGSGYPEGLKGDEICLNARLIAVADVFDALTCKRVYNNPVDPEEAVAYLESCGGQYDQNIVAILKKKVLDGTLRRKEIITSFVE